MDSLHRSGPSGNEATLLFRSAPPPPDLPSEARISPFHKTHKFVADECFASDAWYVEFDAD
jgi:hypothetical protein